MRDDVHAVMVAVDEVHVCDPGPPEHDGRARRRAAMRVRGGIELTEIGLDLDEPRGTAAVRAIVDEHPSEKIARDDDRGARVEGARQADRKSTRLNSSHSQISYAVFCLKQKKRKYSAISLWGAMLQHLTRRLSHFFLIDLRFSIKSFLSRSGSYGFPILPLWPISRSSHL